MPTNLTICSVCGKPLDLTEKHITVVRHVERMRARAVDVLSAEVLATMHRSCGERIGSGVGTATKAAV